MSKIKSDKINFNGNDFVVAADDLTNPDNDTPKNDEVTKEELEKNRLAALSNEIIEKAQKKAQEIINSAEAEKENILKEANSVLSKAKDEAGLKLSEAEKEKEELIAASKDEIQQEKTDSAKLGYQEGYKDGEEKLYEELDDKIQAFNTFCDNQYEIKNKILKSASKDILDIITNISRKILLKEIDGEIIERIIKKTIGLFEKKENINIILSEKYARLLYEFQKKSMNSEIEFNFEDFKQFENFAILYNPKLSDDTIIIENMKERFDASINTQLDIIIRDILENTSNGQIEDVEEYGENEA